MTLGRGNAVAPFAAIDSLSSPSSLSASVVGGVSSSVGRAGGREIFWEMTRYFGLG